MPTYQGRTVSRQRLHQLRYPEKHRARKAVAQAISTGELLRPDKCDQCSRPCKPQAHHDDYDNPLAVRWLCSGKDGCHSKADQRQRYPAGGVACRVCGRPARHLRKALCDLHHGRLRRLGSPWAEPAERAAKASCSCGTPARVRGRCLRCAWHFDPLYREQKQQAKRKYGATHREQINQRHREYMRLRGMAP